MSTTHSGIESNRATRSRRRSAWRQRLVDAERGISLGIRTDSALFVHFFGGCVILAAGFVLKIELLQWALLTLAITVAVSAELFHLVLRTICAAISPRLEEKTDRVLRMGTAAVFVAMLGSVTTIGIVFAHQFQRLFNS